MDPPAADDEVKPENLEEAKERGPLFHCDLLDTEVVHKIAEALLPGLSSACVDNTIGGLFKTPGAVAVDVRREMVDYLFQRSENFVAESVVLEGGPDAEVPDHPYDIVSDFVDDFARSKRNFFSKVSGWLLSERREDRIDDFVQEMELNGFWLIGRREAVSQTLVKNVDIKNIYHCDKKFKSPEELEEHLANCSFRIMNCMNEGCNATFSAGQFDYHDSICPFKILPCEQKCSESIMRRQMDRHCITVCPMKLTKCPFYQVGCQSVIPQSTINQHRTEHLQSHLVYILQPLHREASIEDLKKRADQLEKLSSAGRLGAARDARALTYLIKDLEAKLGPLEISSKTNDGEAGGESNGTKEEKTDPSPEKMKDGEADGESNGTKEEKTDSSPEKMKDGEAGGESNGTKEEKTDFSPEKIKDGEASGESNGPEEKTDASPKKMEDCEAGGELSGSKEEKTDSSPKRTNDGEARGKLSDKKEGKTYLSPKKVESLKPFSGKEDSPESSIEHIQRRDSSPGKCSTSSSEHEDNGNLQDEKEELTESAHREEKSPDSPVERKILMEPPATEGAEESTLKEEVHAESPAKGDEGI